MANSLSIAGFLLGVVAFSAPLFAHHGDASFDSLKMVTVKGTVTEYVWSNPHVLVKVDAKDDTGNIARWVLEAWNPVTQASRGWSKNTFKPGDELTLTYLRQGQPQTAKATLIEKEVAVMPDGNVIDSGFVTGPGPWTFNNNEVMKLLRTDGENSEATSVFSDNEHTLEVRTEDGGKKHLLAKDRDGKVLYDGPIDTDQQRAALPKEIGDKLKKLEERVKAVSPDGKNVRVRVFEP